MNRGTGSVHDDFLSADVRRKNGRFRVSGFRFQGRHIHCSVQRIVLTTTKTIGQLFSVVTVVVIKNYSEGVGGSHLTLCKCRIFTSIHPTTVKNVRQIITFLFKLLHNSNKSRTFVPSVLAKPLNNAQPTTNREQCQTCLNIAEVRRRSRLLKLKSCEAFFVYGTSYSIHKAVDFIFVFSPWHSSCLSNYAEISCQREQRQSLVLFQLTVSVTMVEKPRSGEIVPDY